MPKMSPLASVLFLAQTAASSPAAAGPVPGPMDGLKTMVPFLLLMVALYFFMIAPQRKKQKEHERMLKELKSGDEVVTSGGIFGTITNVKDDRFVLKIADTTKIEVAKGFIQSVVTRDDSGEKK
jgi:preprotein translocase subunit YajC